jgi:hypothetical protein
VQNNEKKRLRDFRESFEEKRKGQQAGCIFQETLGTFPKAKLCFVSAENYCCVGGRTVRIHTVCTAGRRARCLRQFVGTEIEAVLSILCCKKGPYSRLRAQISRCCFMGGSYSSMDLTHFSRKKFGGTVLGVVSGFLLAVNVILLLI